MNEPVAWQCKDYADGWITYWDREEAIEYQKLTGCSIRSLYTEKQVQNLEKDLKEAYRLLRQVPPSRYWLSQFWIAACDRWLIKYRKSNDT